MTEYFVIYHERCLARLVHGTNSEPHRAHDKSNNPYLNGRVSCEENLRWLDKKLLEHYEIDVQIIDLGNHDCQQAKALNRISTFTEQG